MASLSPTELRKRNNFSLFKTRIATRGDFTLVEGNGSKVKVDPRVAKQIKTVDDLVSFYTVGNSIILPTTMNKQIRLTQLYKDSAFSGRSQNTTAAEDEEIRIIRESLSKLKEKLGSDSVNLQIGKNYYQVVDVESTPGTPKSDFHFRDVNGRMVGFVSHKDGSSPTAIQQWGGITQRGEPVLAAHPETKAFVETCRQMFPDGIPPATTVARRIKDKNLKLQSVYGSGYSANARSSIQNVDLLLQGRVSLQNVSGNKYRLVAAAQTHKNGEDLTGGNEPVFMAIYKGDRNNYGIKGARLVISAKGGRNIKQYV